MQDKQEYKKTLTFALLGAGFWARYQLAAWGEQDSVSCLAICDPDTEKAAAIAARFGVPGVYASLEEMLIEQRPDFVDVVTPPHTHASLVHFCVSERLPVICQKPLAETVSESEAMVAACASANIPLLVHENWRWQTPLRTAGELLKQGTIGTPFRARLTFSCSFPVFENQPFLGTLERFILTDIGSHVLDAARYLFGEAHSVYCETHKINPTISGEDVATVVMPMGAARTTVVCEMSYASRTEHERFPQTYLFVEGEDGSLEIGPDYLLRITRRSQGAWNAPRTEIRRCLPPRYSWADPVYDLVQASMVGCQADLLKSLRGEGTVETTGADNLETVRLVAMAYESAHSGQVKQP
jgi:D-apiose dehydrogenase